MSLDSPLSYSGIDYAEPRVFPCSLVQSPFDFSVTAFCVGDIISTKRFYQGFLLPPAGRALGEIDHGGIPLRARCSGGAARHSGFPRFDFSWVFFVFLSSAPPPSCRMIFTRPAPNFLGHQSLADLRHSCIYPLPSPSLI